jgi:tetratricopeptide (TPR) repeat protein
LGCAQNAQNEHPELFINMMSTLAVGDAYYMARGHSPSSLKLLISASELAKSLKDLEAAHYLYARVGDTYRVLYANYDKAFEAYERALSLARIIKNKHLEAISLTLIGIVEFQRQSNEELKYFELAEEIAQGANDHLALSLILQHKGFISGHSNDWNATQTLSLKAIEIAHHIRANDQLHYAQATERLFFALLNLGEAQRRLGNFSEALITRTSALRLAEDENKQIWIAYALQEIGEMYHDAQKEDLALPKFEEALKIYRENNANADIQQVESFLEKHNYYDSVKL